MKNFELHIFTNSTINSPSTELITHTYNSFLETFNVDCPVTVWYDPKPNKEKADLYYKNLIKKFTNINITKSLSDGYIKAVETSQSDFLCMLEHDWEFLPTITNSIDDILDTIQEDNILHFRFNKRKNNQTGWDTYLEEIQSKNFLYCKTPCLSNNPHIIQKDLYTNKALQYLKVSKSSKGIEHELSSINHLEGSIYGPLNYPPTIKHLDGRSIYG